MELAQRSSGLGIVASQTAQPYRCDFTIRVLMSPGLSIYDYCAIGFYFAFMALIGWICRRFISNTSDYFRGGGKMLWWMAGCTAFVAQFSAWTFTGAAGKAYKDGAVIMVIYLANALGFFC